MLDRHPHAAAGHHDITAAHQYNHISSGAMRCDRRSYRAVLGAADDADVPTVGIVPIVGVVRS
nr:MULTISPECIES: hypothetical protein [unclassified Rhodococcus (in: high G+C Gram-positive bacteria)]